MKINKINHAIIMAAGRGIRMRPLTYSIPKAMAPIKGSTLIAEGVKKLSKHFNNIHITVGHQGAILASHVIDLKVNSVFNTNNKGNSWWLYNTLIKNIDEPIFVLTCDNVVDMDFNLYLKDYYKNDSPACLVVPVTPINNLEGDYITSKKNNNVIKISRTHKTDIYCSGIQILNPKKINKITRKKYNFIDVWEQLISLNQLKKSSLVLKKWYAIDNMEQLNKFNKKIYTE